MVKTQKIIEIIERRYVVSTDELARALKDDKGKVIKLLDYLVRRGKIVKIRRGYYTIKPVFDRVNVLATALLRPAYISLAYALMVQNIITQYITEVEVMTTKKFPRSMREIEINGIKIRFYRIKRELFFGYRWEEEDGFYYAIAYPEKALLDLHYIGINPEDMFTIDWSKINSDRLIEYSRLFPKRVKDWATKIANALQANLLSK